MKVCGGCLNGAAVGVLEAVGAGCALERCCPVPIRDLRIHLSGRTARIPLSGSVVVARETFDQALTDLAVSSGAVFAEGMTAEVVPPCGERTRFSDRRSVRLTASADHVTDTTFSADAGHPADRVSAHRSADAVVTAKAVLVCDGLAHSSVRGFSEFRSIVRPGARVGAGIVCAIDESDSELKLPDLQMAVCNSGYVGCVPRSDGRLNIAAAVNADLLQHQPSGADPTTLSGMTQQSASRSSAAGRSPSAVAGSIVDAVTRVLREAGAPVPENLSGTISGLPAPELVRGTPLLTRSTPTLAAERVFLLGDSTGYVEPFTGEGMAWALTAAVAVQPLVADVVANGWSASSEERWNAVFRRTIGGRQQICRLLTRSLRYPWLLDPLLAACRTFPSVTQLLIRRINRVPVTISAFPGSESRL